MNILVQDNTFSDLNVSYYIFDIQLVHKAFLHNVLVENTAGPLFSFEEVLQHNLDNITLNNVTTSNELRPVMQYLISIENQYDAATDGLDPTRPTGTNINRLNINVTWRFLPLNNLL